MLNLAAQVGGVVEAAHDPALGGHDDVAERGVVCSAEGEAAGAAGLPDHLADHAAVHDRHHQLVGMLAGDAFDPASHTGGELLVGFGTRDDVPALLGDHPHGDRIAVRETFAELAALPLAEEHLAQLRLDDRLLSERGEERGGGLSRALQRGDVHRGDALTGGDQTRRGLLGLLPPFRRQRRVAVPVDEREVLAVDVRRRLAVTQEQELACARWRLEPWLGKRSGAGHGATVTVDVRPVRASHCV